MIRVQLEPSNMKILTFDEPRERNHFMRISQPCLNPINAKNKFTFEEAPLYIFDVST